jgi:hypothetical protein
MVRMIQKTPVLGASRSVPDNFCSEYTNIIPSPIRMHKPIFTRSAIWSLRRMKIGYVARMKSDTMEMTSLMSTGLLQVIIDLLA